MAAPLTPPVAAQTATPSRSSGRGAGISAWGDL